MLWEIVGPEKYLVFRYATCLPEVLRIWRCVIPSFEWKTLSAFPIVPGFSFTILADAIRNIGN